MAQPVYRKYWKAKFNRLYTANFVIEQKCARMSADNFNTIEVTNEGINLQPGPGGSVSIQTLSVKGPFTKKTPFPFTLLPGIISPPVEFIDGSLIEIVPEMAAVAVACSMIVATAAVS